jgi:hypothetical protein
MYKTIITPENEVSLRNINRRDGYMKKAVNLAIKELFHNHTNEEILKLLKAAEQ